MAAARSGSRLAPVASAPPAARSSPAGAGRLPNFIVIGAARSGTTSLHYALGQHPQVYMSPNKETNFFSFYSSGGQVPPCTRLEDMASIDGRSIKTLEDYCAQFRGVTDERAVGETSPSYLLLPAVPRLIREMIPESRLITILRQPIDKAYSHFLWRRSAAGYAEDADFAEVLERDEERICREGRGTSFLGVSRYYQHLKPYYEVFDRERIKICLFDDMETRPQQLYEELFSFLGVDPRFRPDFAARLNQTGTPKRRSLDRLTHLSKPLKNALRRRLPPAVVTRLSRWQHKLKSVNIERPQGVPPELRRALTRRYYGDELARLEALIDRDLSHWLA